MFPRSKASARLFRLSDCTSLSGPLYQGLIAACASLALSVGVQAGSLSAVSKFRHEIQPVLQEYCYECHGDGANKGGIAFDELTSNDAILNPTLWLKVLKNERSGLMPPAN